MARTLPASAVAVAWLLAQRIVAAPIANAYAPAHVDEDVIGREAHGGELAE